ncbi:MAG: pentapeptide repeat-containing protein [Anaerolineae bacterium]|nr:pentapeptide repeat-containing protein [Anaerolineae bacterium]
MNPQPPIHEHELSREQEIARIWQREPWLYGVIGFVFGLLAIPAIQLLATDPMDLLTALVPEGFGIAVTVLLIDRFNRRRDQQLQERDLKNTLIRGTGSLSNEISKDSIHQLRKRQWLCGSDSLLVGQDFSGANWKQVDLWQANLDHTRLQWVNMERAYIYLCSFRNADLEHSNLSGADLRGADLSGANLLNVNLNNAIVSGISDNGIYREARFSEDTTLPDGTKWTPGRKMTDFNMVTDYHSPQHVPSY